MLNHNRWGGQGARRRGVWAAALLTALVGCAGARGPGGVGPAPVGERVEGLLAEVPLNRVHWGLLVVDAESGRTLFERNPDLLFIPGSNMKLPVTVSALGLLGPEYRWDTAFFSPVTPVDGVLDADLYLFGEGDPTLGAPFHESSEVAVERLVDSLVLAGVREVTGRLSVDVSAWDSASVPESWMVEDLEGVAGATGGPFVLNRGELEIRILGADRAGAPASVSWSPRSEGQVPPDARPFVDNRVVTVGGGIGSPVRARFLPESRQWVIEGEIGVGDSLTLTRAARDPVRLGVSALSTAFAEQGVRISDTETLWDRNVPTGTGCATGSLPSCPVMRRLAGISSPSLIEVVPQILGPSQNWMTEQLVRTLGAELGEFGSWPEGFSVIQRFLEEEGRVRSEDVHWEDGSGLSNHNLITPRALVSILRYARDQSWGEAFRSGLAQPGLEGTTLASRLPELRGRVFAKTGSLSHVNSLSGYVFANDGRELIFAILTNGSNLPASQVRAQIDALVVELLRD